MTATVFERRRTGADIAIGILLILGGCLILANSVAATALTVLVIGWAALIAGVVELVGSFARFHSGGFWSAAIGGVILIVLGVFILRNPVAGAATLTLLAGSLFLATGLVRIFVGSQVTEARWPLVISGIISVLLGLFVLLHLTAATLTLLGILLGVQVLIEGVTRLAVGRMRPIQPTEAPPPGAGAAGTA